MNVTGYAPPEIAALVMYVGTSGMAVALYSLLKLWIESRNGRKLRIKVGDIEVEASQMTVRQFEELFAVIERHRHDLDRDKSTLRHDLRSNGIVLLEGLNAKQQLDSERQAIREAVTRSFDRLFNSRGPLSGS